MARVFISHCSADNYFVDFLAELLRNHRIDVWADLSNLEAGNEFTAEIETALEASDALIVILSKSSPQSKWMTRELSRFKAVNDGRPVVPVVLEPGVDLDDVYEGLSLVTHLRCYESMLVAFREILRLLGRELFPVVENRQAPDRRAADRRAEQADRRRGANQRLRLRKALNDYVESAGWGLFKPMSRWDVVDDLVRVLLADSSPLHSFVFTDRKTDDEVKISHEWLRKSARTSHRRMSERGGGWVFNGNQSSQDDDQTGPAYVIDDVVDKLIFLYHVTTRDRRSGDRRSGESRRKDEDLAGR